MFPSRSSKTYNLVLVSCLHCTCFRIDAAERSKYIDQTSAVYVAIEKTHKNEPTCIHVQCNTVYVNTITYRLGKGWLLPRLWSVPHSQLSTYRLGIVYSTCSCRITCLSYVFKKLYHTSLIYRDNVQFLPVYMLVYISHRNDMHAGSVLSANLVENIENEKKSNVLVHAYSVRLAFRSTINAEILANN